MGKSAVAQVLPITSEHLRRGGDPTLRRRGARTTVILPHRTVQKKLGSPLTVRWSGMTPR